MDLKFSKVFVFLIGLFVVFLGAFLVSAAQQIGGLYATDDGRVGIGTNYPSYKFHVNEGTIGVNSDANTRWQIAGSSGAFAIRDDNLGIYRFWINKANGNVGIGTNSPTEKLEVNGNIKATDVCTTAGKCLSSVGGNVGNNAWSSSGSIVYYSGNVGIGTSSPSYKLHVEGGTIGLNSDADTRWQIIGSSGAFAIRDDNLGIYRFWINKANGNVGIGTTSPTKTLDVNGDIKAKTATFDGLTVSGKVKVQKVCFPDGSCLDASNV